MDPGGVKEGTKTIGFQGGERSERGGFGWTPLDWGVRRNEFRGKPKRKIPREKTRACTERLRLLGRGSRVPQGSGKKGIKKSREREKSIDRYWGGVFETRGWLEPRKNRTEVP